MILGIGPIVQGLEAIFGSIRQHLHALGKIANFASQRSGHPSRMFDPKRINDFLRRTDLIACCVGKPLQSEGLAQSGRLQFFKQREDPAREAPKIRIRDGSGSMIPKARHEEFAQLLSDLAGRTGPVYAQAFGHTAQSLDRMSEQFIERDEHTRPTSGRRFRGQIVVEPEACALLDRECIARSQGQGNLGRVPVCDDKTRGEIDLGKDFLPPRHEETESRILDRPECPVRKALPKQSSHVRSVRVQNALRKSIQRQGPRIIPRKSQLVQ